MAKNKVYILDTSIQIRRLLDKKVENEVKRLRGSGKVFSLHFVYYEYRVGLLRIMIEYYFAVKTFGKADAALEISDRFGRDAKFYTLFREVIDRDSLGTSWKTEEEYLDRVEAAIRTVDTLFSSNIDGCLGSFIDDEIVNYTIKSKDDFRGFMDLLKKRKSLFPLMEYWEKRLEELELLVNAKSSFGKKYLKMHKRLSSIQENRKRCLEVRINQGVGDAVIASDVEKSHTIVSLDRLHEVLCGALGKKFIILEGRKRMKL